MPTGTLAWSNEGAGQKARNPFGNANFGRVLRHSSLTYLKVRRALSFLVLFSNLAFRRDTALRDQFYSHIAWLRTIREKIKFKDMQNIDVTFPLISDVTMEIAKKYGMVQPNASGTQAVRAVFFIDPGAKIRALIYYPLSNGRNFQEIKRLLIAMQAADKYKIATPADWQPGDDVIVPPPGSCGTAKERVEKAGKDYYCLDWFLCFKKLARELLTPAALTSK